MKAAAVWVRVSDEKSSVESQIPDIERFTIHHGLTEVSRYQMDDDGAWKDGGSPKYQAMVKQALDDAWAGQFRYLVVWALDRLTRNGAEDALRLIRQFRERGVMVLSVKEPWLSMNPEVQDVLVSFAGWVAQQESQRRSDRVKAGMARARMNGKQIGGRKPGSKDKVKSAARSAGNKAAWERRKGMTSR